MYDVWIIDFVANEKRLYRGELSWKKARKLTRKLNKLDRYSLAVTLPFGFRL
jgi:hypothetical protein